MTCNRFVHCVTLCYDSRHMTVTSLALNTLIAMRKVLLAVSALIIAGCGTNEARPSGDPEPGITIGEDGGVSGVESDAGGTPVEDTGGTPGQDTGISPDTSTTIDASVEHDTDRPVDTGTGTDGGGVTDSGTTLCEPGATECDGNILLSCSESGDAIGRTRCEARGAICGIDASGNAACIEPSCEAGEAFCSEDLSRIEVCNRFGVFEYEDCEFGCNPERLACNPEPGACEIDYEVLEPGEFTFDLCGSGDDTTHADDGENCGTYRNRGEEVVFQFTLDRAAEVFLDLQDFDDSGAIDTILYLRSECDEQDSQIACSDDIACEESTVEVGECNGGVQVRQSRIVEDLGPGTYYVVADNIEYDDFRCGPVLLTFEVE